MSAYVAAAWTRWSGWLDSIRDEIYDLHHHHEIWRGLVDRIEAKKLNDSEYFLDAFTRMYVAGQAMAVRRQAENDKKVVSLGRLLATLTTQSKVVTRERFFGLWELDNFDPTNERDIVSRRFLEGRAREVWATFARHADNPHLDPAVPEADRQRIEAEATKVAAFADRSIAHSDRRGVVETPTFQELHDAMRLLGEIYCRYSLLLTGSAPSPSQLAPVIQGDWLAPFRQPLEP